MNTMKEIIHQVEITPGRLTIDGMIMDVPHDAATDFVTAIYRTYIGDYPKYYKMDAMTRLGFVGAELLMRRLPRELCDECAIITFSRHASLAADTAYCSTIHPDDYYPAPAQFVYTLPNILTGEIAIRHKCHGETCHYVTAAPDTSLYARAGGTCAAPASGASDAAYMTALANPASRPATLYGLVDYISPSRYECRLTLRYTPDYETR